MPQCAARRGGAKPGSAEQSEGSTNTILEGVTTVLRWAMQGGAEQIEGSNEYHLGRTAAKPRLAWFRTVRQIKAKVSTNTILKGLQRCVVWRCLAGLCAAGRGRAKRRFQRTSSWKDCHSARHSHAASCPATQSEGSNEYHLGGTATVHGVAWRRKAWQSEGSNEYHFRRTCHTALWGVAGTAIQGSAERRFQRIPSWKDCHSAGPCYALLGKAKRRFQIHPHPPITEVY